MGTKDPDGQASISNLAEYLNRHVAIPNGYKLVVRRKDKRPHGFYMEVKCTRGRAAKVGSGSKSKTHTHLSQAGDEVCCFFLPVYYDENVKLFFFKQHCWPIFDHVGHSKIHPDHMTHGKSVIPPETMKIAEDLLGKHCSPKVVQLLLTIMSGERISRDSMAKMRSAVHMSKFREKKNESTADTLLNILKNNKSITYCYLTASYDE